MTSKYITFRIKLTRSDDLFSEVPRKDLGGVFLELLTSAGPSIALAGGTYSLKEDQVVGR